MRVVHVHRISGIGGSERHLLALLPALRAHGVEPSFVGLDDPRTEPEPFYAALEDAGVPFARIPARHDLDPRLPFRIARAARPFDSVHVVGCEWRVFRTPGPEIVRHFFKRIGLRLDT